MPRLWSWHGAYLILPDLILPSYSIIDLHNILIASRHPGSLAVEPRRLRPDRMRT